MPAKRRKRPVKSKSKGAVTTVRRRRRRSPKSEGSMGGGSFNSFGSVSGNDLNPKMPNEVSKMFQGVSKGMKG